jgi:hypothetical protein
MMSPFDKEVSMFPAAGQSVLSSLKIGSRPPGAPVAGQLHELKPVHSHLSQP